MWNKVSKKDAQFICKNGEIQLCSVDVLSKSGYYSRHAELYEKFENPLRFTYNGENSGRPYDEKVINVYLDSLHDIQLDHVNYDELPLMLVIETMDFLLYEGKATESKFEGNMMNGLMQSLIKRKFELVTKLLIASAISKMDNEPHLPHKYTQQYEASVGKDLLLDLTEESFVFDLEGTSEINQHLIKWCISKGLFENPELEDSVNDHLMSLKNWLIGETWVAFK